MLNGVVIELVSFATRDDVSEVGFVRVAESANALLRGCAGFIRRRLAKSDAKEWVDDVDWQTVDDALAAARRFNDAPETRAFNTAIRPGSVVMRHLTAHVVAN
jgi:hypothetical protein